ncbi:MAG TPA: hypothetical protein ENH65_01090 [Candidatus Aminicenantes bacterium]|nr:hypothetical protein [Candidatus Aminicenantes bacterium]
MFNVYALEGQASQGERKPNTMYLPMTPAQSWGLLAALAGSIVIVILLSLAMYHILESARSGKLAKIWQFGITRSIKIWELNRQYKIIKYRYLYMKDKNLLP